MAANLNPEPLLRVDASDAAFLVQECLASLGTAQNDDGGWGYHPGSSSSVESTSWASLAMACWSTSKNIPEKIRRAQDWLRRTQLPDGSWPSFPGHRRGCWVTSLAGLALHPAGESEGAVARGTEWLCNSWPRDGNLWLRALRWLLRTDRLSTHDSSLRGWGWTPRTSSWVEPTACALLLLQTRSGAGLPPGARRRRRLGEAMLLDRMCRGGGWNCGNPVVYGVPGEPQIGPTSLALLALQEYHERDEIQLSIKWLAHSLRQVQSPASLALGLLCLKTYGRQCESLATTLVEASARNQSLQDILMVQSWIILALSGKNGRTDSNLHSGPKK